ncbi:MAG TPA: GNAT family N-acetyltransferase [Aggregatilineaceae bacterium]|nr:GNAT family N-acetyltransferase [Aggregatilineaceae bacterium]
MSNPILLDFPEQIESERLIIRAPRPGDGAAIVEAIRESLVELRPWMPWAQDVPTVASAEESIRRAAALFMTREDMRLNMYRKSDGLFVGGSGLHRFDWSVPRFEIGYWVRTSLQGQGYVTEMVEALTAFCFGTLGAKRMEIHCDARNTRSYAVAERAGYQFEARLRHHARDVYGELSDTLIYAKFPEG